jgi:hypothetical protein
MIDDREVVDAYFNGKATLQEALDAIRNSSRGDSRRREIEREFNETIKRHKLEESIK